MSLRGVELRLEKLERFYGNLDSGVMTIIGATPDGRLIAGEPTPGRQITLKEAAQWKGMLLFTDADAAALIAPQAPRKHDVEIILCDDGNMKINRFNGWKGAPFRAPV